MIPKKIHYCWFGRGEKPKLAQKCIASWKKYMPDYEIIEWNEDNFDVYTNAYTKMCYEEKKYAFLTDYLRLLIVFEHGGIYFDTDVEVLKPFDDLLHNDVFLGWENNDFVNTGEGFGAAANHPIVEQMIREYDELMDGKNGTIGCPNLNTRALDRYGLAHNGEKQVIEGAVVYPVEWFNPRNSVTGELKTTKNSYSIHWYAMSWLPKSQQRKTQITRLIKRLCGEKCLEGLKGFIK